MSIDQQITFIYTKDLPRAARFYETVLGFVPVLIQKGGCRIYKTAGEGGFLGICRERPGRISHPEGTILCWVTQDVDGWNARLRDAGVPTEGPPAYSEAFGVYHLFFRDPDGHLLEIQRFDDPDWSVPLDNAGPDDDG